eukprot:gene12392-26070_t
MFLLPSLLLLCIVSQSYADPIRRSRSESMKDVRNRKNENYDMWTNRCSSTQITFQYKNIYLVDPSTCENNLIAWRVAQLMFPNAGVFLDIGANMGYISAMIFGLWSPGHGLSRKSLYNSIVKYGYLNKNVDNGTNTVCRDGLKDDIPILCIGLKGGYKPPETKLQCSVRNRISVYSFDGEKLHATNIKNIINQAFPHLSSSKLINNKMINNTSIDFNDAKWEYIHSAIVGPELQHKDTGYFSQLGHEGSSFIGINPPKDTNTNTNTHSILPVPIITIDKFCRQRRLSRVDVIKLDIEGGEFTALYGANRTLSYRNTKFITYECNQGYCDEQSHIDLLNYLYNHGFICYMAGLNDLLFRLTNCLDVSLAHLSEGRLRGNVYCGHEIRSPGLISAMDAISLHTYSEGRRGDIKDGAMLGKQAYVENNKVKIEYGN